jgi:hypothetical protein
MPAPPRNTTHHEDVMTPERQTALEAVVKAARAWRQTNMHIEPHSNEECEAYERFEDALHALDALPPDPAPAGNVVEVGAVEYRDGEIRFARVGSEWWGGLIDRQWRPLGTVRLPLTEGGR